MMDKDLSKILATEYSERFDTLRKQAMITSFYKYGPVQKNYHSVGGMDAVANIRKRLEKYIETGNTEFLVDVANFAMIEFMYPQLEGASYQPTDSGACETIGVSVNEIQREMDMGDGWKSQYYRNRD